MDEWGYGLIALLLVVIPITLLIGFQYSLKIIMPITLATIVLLALFVWNMTPERVLASVIQGVTITASILWMIFSAIFLLNALKQTGAIQIIRQSFTEVSSDKRIQVIIIAWCFGIFIEGVSTFGTSAVIIAPLLLALGFPPLAAIIMTMLIQTTSFYHSNTTFSFITYSASNIKNNVDVNHLDIQTLNKEGLLGHFLELITHDLITHTIISTFTPLFMVLILTRFFSVNKSWKESFVVLPFALFAGLTFTIPYALTKIFLGPEFPYILGSLTSLFIVFYAAKQKFLFPEVIWKFPCETLWEKKWLGALIVEKKYVLTSRISPLSAWSPYLLISLMLFCSYALIELELLFIDLNLIWENILGEIGISANITSLYLSGGLLIITALFAIASQCKSTECFKMVKDASINSFNMMLAASILLIFTLPVITIYLNSNINLLYVSSMPMATTNLIANLLGSTFPSISPLVHTLLSVSNPPLTSQFQFETANNFFASTMIIIFQALGTAAKNMLNIQNVIAASAIVGIFGQEAAILRKTVTPIICYILITGIISMLILYSLNINNPFLG